MNRSLRYAVAFGLALALFCPCAASGADGMVVGEPTPLAGGKMTVCWLEGPARAKPDLLLHFHGGAPTAVKNLTQSGVDAVLVTVNFNGLSKAYSGPFSENPRLFQEVLDRAMGELKAAGAATADAEWGTICVSSFSAGYGAVREILKNPEYFKRIDALHCADTIYAGLVPGEEQRRVDPGNMRDYRRFAELAVAGKKTFVLTHCEIKTPYASTVETADDLLAHVGMKREAAEEPAADDAYPLLSRAQRGKFTVLGYAGADGDAHMHHLRQIGRWWKLLPLHKRL